MKIITDSGETVVLTRYDFEEDDYAMVGSDGEYDYWVDITPSQKSPRPEYPLDPDRKSVV